MVDSLLEEDWMDNSGEMTETTLYLLYRRTCFYFVIIVNTKLTTRLRRRPSFKKNGRPLSWVLSTKASSSVASRISLFILHNLIVAHSELIGIHDAWCRILRFYTPNHTVSSWAVARLQVNQCRLRTSLRVIFSLFSLGQLGVRISIIDTPFDYNLKVTHLPYPIRTHQALLCSCGSPRVWAGRHYSDLHSSPTRTRQNPNRSITSISRKTFGKFKGLPTNQVNAYTLCILYYGSILICSALEEFSRHARHIA